MLLKITQHCSMGCSHCMNNATPNGKHMTEETLRVALKFLIDNNCYHSVIVSGGEPTEHPDFLKFMNIIIDTLNFTSYPHMITITTNGFWCLEHMEEAKSIVRNTPYCNVVWQVSTDNRYYPKELPIHKKLWREPGFTLCTDCVESMYPQGRAVDNNYDWNCKSSKCFNVRAIAKQIPNPTVESIVMTMLKNRKVCTPAIQYDGSIKLGESDLCPVCASIYDSPEDIVKKIIQFKCHECDHVNNNLPALYKRFL